MEKQNVRKDAPTCPCDEMKIYTPRTSSRMQKESPSLLNALDQAPVRIYERPLRTDYMSFSHHNDIG